MITKDMHINGKYNYFCVFKDGQIQMCGVATSGQEWFRKHIYPLHAIMGNCGDSVQLLVIWVTIHLKDKWGHNF